MSFRINGGGAGGSGVAVWQYLTKEFNNIDVASDQFIEIWDPK